MTKTERKLLLVNGTVGAVLTLLVMLLDHAELFKSTERWFYRRRALDCQYFIKAPTDRLVFLDIDDAALESIERWPWKRSTMAGILDEVNAAKPALVFLDILFSEPQDSSMLAQADGSTVTLNHDQALAQSMARAGNIYMPLALDWVASREKTAADTALENILLANLELTPEEAAAELVKQNHPKPESGEAFNTLFVIARRTAMYKRIEQELSKSESSIIDLRARLLPKTDPRIVSSVLLRLLASQYEKVAKLRPLQRFMLPCDDKAPPLLGSVDETAPLSIFSLAVGGTGFVNAKSDDDGTLRRMPLLAAHRDHVVPQMGLVIACRLLGADVSKVHVDADKLTIPLPDGKNIIVPVRLEKQTGTGKPIGALMAVPYLGGADWQTMFDRKKKSTAAHVPVNMVWQVIQTRQAIAINNTTADRAVFELKKTMRGEDEAKEYINTKREPEDAAPRLAAITEMLKLLDDSIAAFTGELTPQEKQDVEGLKKDRNGMASVAAENKRLLDQLTRQRGELQTRMKDKAVLIGSTATAGIDDFVPTPLHDQCPGVVVYGVIANGILTGELWRTAPGWITRLITILMGLTTTCFVLFLSPTKAAVYTVLLAVFYFIINGIIIFDYFNTIVGVAGPVFAMMISWATCQLIEMLVEQAERRRITKRFRSYVDPALVNYVINHPEEKVMEGKEREMTVVFTDLAGFTTISETLKEKVVPLLNEYLGLMTKIIRKHKGYVNKFLGDGIMFFYNAPDPNEDHAADAAATVLEMQEELIGFNEGLVKRGLPAITMRAGITTGTMVVGDAGSPDGSDYTVLGDNVNLAARLEGANKATGTKVLMLGRTAEMLGDRYLCRPVANLQVKGKTEGVMTCELMAAAGKATPDQVFLAALSKTMYEKFASRDFHGCLQAIAALESAFGESKLAGQYREMCNEYLITPPGPDFCGQIVLHEK